MPYGVIGPSQIADDCTNAMCSDVNGYVTWLTCETWCFERKLVCTFGIIQNDLFFEFCFLLHIYTGGNNNGTAFV